jgi:hypothetical protein
VAQKFYEISPLLHFTDILLINHLKKLCTMDSSLLSSDFKVQLKKQRDRLVSRREAIIQEAIKYATGSIDANLAHIDNLLSKATSASKAKITTTRGRPKKEKTEVSSPTASKSVVSATRSKAKEPKSKTTAKSKQKASVSQTDAPSLKPEFKDLKLAQAIPLVFKKDAGRIFSIDNVITALYGTVEPAVHAKTRQRIGVSLGHSAGREEIVKVQLNPAMYRLNN